MLGRLAQLVEHLVYTERVIGSSPLPPTIYGGVVQLVRTLACHARGRGFESLHSRQKKNSVFTAGFFWILISDYKRCFWCCNLEDL